MYEAEVNSSTESITALPSGVAARFVEFSPQIARRTTLPWGEHCTECNWPICYTTCELYSARADGACRLFIDGAVRIDCLDAPNSYLLKIRFKQWGKLWTVGTIALSSPADARKRERSNLRTGALARSLPMPAPLRHRVLGKINYLRRRAAEDATTADDAPDCFVIECYNPGQRTVVLTLSMRDRHDRSAQPFQTAISVPPGFLREKVSFDSIARVIDVRKPFEVEIVPNDADGIVLYFGLVDFVKLAPPATEPAIAAVADGAKRWKCLVWDLDNTLWDGILIEDGPDRIRVRQSIVDVIKETDRRGILHSIASKNNAEDAMKVLRLCGLDDYFLHPQIHWHPKSKSIAAIAQSLNIGLDSIAFIDDQPFEREEVKAALPMVATVDARDAESIVGRAECSGPVTEESRQRRLLYRQQDQRQTAQESYGGNYLAFLKDCNIQLTASPLTEANQERVYELAQRTNQMNFSGKRYPRSDLESLRHSQHHESLVLKCSDRFGSYGIVGFAVVDKREPRLIDLMFSCRVQGKRVEHAFLCFLIQRFVGDRSRDFFVNYRRTAKNQVSGKVFDDLGFETVDETDGTSSLVLRTGPRLPEQTIIGVHVEDTGPA